jgi:hypothetical protein
VDLGTEGLKRWHEKADAYLKLAFSGLYERTFRRQYFRVLVVAPSERRVASLSAAIATKTDRIFWFTTAGQLERGGPLDAIWLRPKGNSLQSLIP